MEGVWEKIAEVTGTSQKNAWGTSPEYRRTDWSWSNISSSKRTNRLKRCGRTAIRMTQEEVVCLNRRK